MGLAVHQSEEAGFVNFLWTCQTTRVIAGKMHSQSPILKTKGAPRNPVILTYLWEQSCILHALTKLPAYCNFYPKCLQCLKTVCLYNSFGVGKFSFWPKVGSHEQVDLPIHRLQHQMLGCQLSHTCLSLIAHTWP